MSDSIVHEIIQSTNQARKLQPAPFGGINSSQATAASYFRYKGVKVKYADIEQELEKSGLVHKAIILSAEDQEGEKRLVAYINAAPFNQRNIKKHLEEKLPAYMVPEIYIPVQQFPLTAAGKVDTAALALATTNPAKIKGEYIAPRNETEKTLVVIIQKLLGIENLSVEDNFFELGGGSLQAIRVISAISKAYSLTLDIKYFFIYPTIAGLASHLDKLKSKEKILIPGSKFSARNCNCIIPIKTGGRKSPLYIVCGGGGSAFTFQKFAYMLADDQPVYALQQPSDAKELADFPNTIETIAERYVNEILQINPEGPYALSGHCFGGVIALEMAIRLRSLGKPIKMLAMFDVILSKDKNLQPSISKQSHQITNLIKRVASKAYFKLNFETFLFMRHPKQAVEYKLNSLKSMANKMYRFQPEDQDLLTFRQFEKKFEIAFNNYKVRKYEGDMLVFYARDHYYFLDKDKNISFKKFKLEEESKNIWNDYATSIKIYEIDGEHSTMFDPSFSTSFANVLQEHLNQ